MMKMWAPPRRNDRSSGPSFSYQPPTLQALPRIKQHKLSDYAAQSEAEPMIPTLSTWDLAKFLVNKDGREQLCLVAIVKL